jgi:hypothetical protein
VVVDSTGVVVSSAPPGLRTIKRTAAITSNAAAAPLAIKTVSACFRRYQGMGAGSKYQVSASNASNAPVSSPCDTGSNSSAGTGSASASSSFDMSGSRDASVRSPIR